MCARARAHGIVSTDKIMRHTNTLIIIIKLDYLFACIDAFSATVSVDILKALKGRERERKEVENNQKLLLSFFFFFFFAHSFLFFDQPTYCHPLMNVHIVPTKASKIM